MMLRIEVWVVLSVRQKTWGRTTIRAVKEATVEQLEPIALHALAHKRVVVTQRPTPVLPHPGFLSQPHRDTNADHAVDVLLLKRGIRQGDVTEPPLLQLLVIPPNVGYPLGRLRGAQVDVGTGLVVSMPRSINRHKRPTIRQRQEERFTCQLIARLRRSAAHGCCTTIASYNHQPNAPKKKNRDCCNMRQ